MTVIHELIKVKVGEHVDIASNITVAGTHLEPDGKGGFLVVIHLLRPVDGLPLTNGKDEMLRQ